MPRTSAARRKQNGPAHPAPSPIDRLLPDWTLARKIKLAGRYRVLVAVAALLLYACSTSVGSLQPTVRRYLPRSQFLPPSSLCPTGPEHWRRHSQPTAVLFRSTRW